MEPLMTQEESYAERRQLFKNIWETAMNIDEKDADIMNKPKVIKTLRLDEVDRCVIGKKKKQRIKNLRIVCNKILDFCDRQDADDTFYEKVVAKGQEPPQHKLALKSKKFKRIRVRRKIKMTESLFSPLGESIGAKKEVYDKNDDEPSLDTNALRDTPNVLKRTGGKRSVTKRSQRRTESENVKGTTSVSGNKTKITKKKSRKRNKPSGSNQLPGSTVKGVKFAISRVHAKLTPSKRILRNTKITF